MSTIHTFANRMGTHDDQAIVSPATNVIRNVLPSKTHGNTKYVFFFILVGLTIFLGNYYCGIGSNNVEHRDVIFKIIDKCTRAGIVLTGFNYEVAPGTRVNCKIYFFYTNLK